MRLDLAHSERSAKTDPFPSGIASQVDPGSLALEIQAIQQDKDYQRIRDFQPIEDPHISARHAVLYLGSRADDTLS